MLYCLLFILIMGVEAKAQKNTSEIISVAGIERIYIDTDEVYFIRIISSDQESIKINTHSEGEYFQDIALKTEVSGSELNITTEYPQKLTGGYDKLSAHKVFSLEIEIHIPQGMQVEVRSNIASLHSTGSYRSLVVELNQGYCQLLDFSGNATVNTFSGNILVETSHGLIDSKSRNGSVNVPDFLPGRNPIRLTSIDGNILVRKTK